MERPCTLREDFISEISEAFIMRYDSIVQRIQASPDISKMFELSVKERAGTIKNLKAAKHRYESWATPLGRFTVHFSALVEVAEHLSVSRRSEEVGKDAARFLQTIDEEVRLQLAMLADFAADCLDFTRWLDDEEARRAAKGSRQKGVGHSHSFSVTFW